VDKLDSKPYIMCFPNCIVDFARDWSDGLHRPGNPEDYTCKCTHVNYVPITEEHAQTVDEIHEFFAQLFPNPELRDYMWAHLASTLIGKIINQTFNIYLGSGRNGKSVMVDLMGKVLGDYKSTVPISLITQRRPGIGASSSEVAQLAGVRYAVMQEPSRNDRLNEGVLKELTGGDRIQARHLFKDSFTFTPKLKLAVCTNVLFNGTNSDDEGFWRRIRVVIFQSYFCENPVDTDPSRPFQFKVDKNIDQKFERWKTVFLAMLVKKAKETMGNVEDCECVMRASNDYRLEQDSFSDFIRTCIASSAGSTVKQSDLIDAFGVWWKTTHSSDARAPEGKELINYMNKRFGTRITPVGATPFWREIALVREAEEDDLETAAGI
jgi:putative DNA primase/helicase